MSEPVGLGIVGLGRWSGAHAHAASRSDRIRLVACHARTEDTRSRFAAAFDVNHAASTFEALLADDRVEAVIVSSPNDFHAEHVTAAISAGKPVLVDKPLAVSVPEGLELWRRVNAARVPVGVAHHARRLAGHRAAREWINGGTAGAVRLAYGDFSNPRGASLRPDAWYRFDRGAAAGALIQVGIHQVEVMTYLLGPPTSVNARFAYRNLGPDMPDTAVVTLTHTGGALSTVTTSWTTPSHYRTTVQAEHGVMDFSLDHSHWSEGDVDAYGNVTLRPHDGPTEEVAVTRGDPLREQLEELGAAARGTGDMEIDIVDGLRAVAVVEAAVRSAGREGAGVRLDGLLREAGASPEEVSRVVQLV